MEMQECQRNPYLCSHCEIVIYSNGTGKNLQMPPRRRSREAITFSSVETITRFLPVFCV